MLCKIIQSKTVLWMSRMKKNSLAHVKNEEQIRGDIDFSPSQFFEHFQAFLYKLQYYHTFAVYVWSFNCCLQNKQVTFKKTNLLAGRVSGKVQSVNEMKISWFVRKSLSRELL
jgi:hypothetical protein